MTQSTKKFRRSLRAALPVCFLSAFALAGCVNSPSEARVFGSFDNPFGRSLSSSQDFQEFKREFERLTEDNGVRDQQLKHFTDAYSRVRHDYVHERKDGELIQLALKGLKGVKGEPGRISPVEAVEAALDSMIGSLDPHSSYMNPNEFRESRIVTNGEFGGLGIEISSDEGLIRVIAPISDTPAERAGLQSGDLITHVDGDSIKGMNLSEAVSRLRGRPRTDVRLRIRRDGVDDFDVTVTRAIIQINPVRWSREGNIGVVRVTHFIRRTEDVMRVAIGNVKKEIGPGIEGLVLDLRNNPGGLLSQSVAVADAFLTRGQIVSVRNRDGDERSFRARSGDLAGKLPLVVLINRGSASASEIVAGALQDHGRATVMGNRSFGKGSVQTIAPLEWDGALRLTTALYYLPSGRTIQGAGVDPDIQINTDSRGRVRREADLPGALPSEKTDHADRPRHRLSDKKCPALGSDREDKLLGCAVEFLKAGSPEKFIASLNSRKNL